MSVTWAAASARLGRNDLPYALVTNWHLLSDADRRHGLHDAWTMAEWPVLHAPADLWVQLFEDVREGDDYLWDDAELRPLSELPKRVVLYRAATEDRALGMSWTDDRDQATWFATRLRPQPVWRVEIAPEDGELLARFASRGESEWVLNLDGWELSHLTQVA